MSNLIDHARREMQLAGLYDRDADYGGTIPDAVLPLIGVLAAQGHSGFSARRVIDIFARLARFEPLTPLTNDTRDWGEVSPGVWQSIRKSSCFSRDRGDTYHDIDEPFDAYGQRVIHRSHEARKEECVDTCATTPPPPQAGEVVLQATERR